MLIKVIFWLAVIQVELTWGGGVFWVNQFIWVKIPKLIKLMVYIYSVLLVLGIREL